MLLHKLPIVLECILQTAAKMKSVSGLTLVSVLVFLRVTLQQEVPRLSNAYRFSTALDGNGLYTLFWDYDIEAGTVSFAVCVKTSGWVGFGISPNGQMTGSDVIIGWVEEDGSVRFHVSNDSYTHLINDACFKSLNCIATLTQCIQDG